MELSFHSHSVKLLCLGERGRRRKESNIRKNMTKLMIFWVIYFFPKFKKSHPSAWSIIIKKEKLEVLWEGVITWFNDLRKTLVLEHNTGRLLNPMSKADGTEGVHKIPVGRLRRGRPCAQFESERELGT